jgi:glycosyltransferase involved in cell wall biosynthesis
VRQLSMFLPPRSFAETSIEGVECKTWPENDHRRGHLVLKGALKRLAPDVIFVPTARWLSNGHVPSLVMVRNMEPLVAPIRGNPVSESIRNLARAYVAREACRRATRLVAVSGFVRDFLVHHWHVSPDKAAVIYHGVEEPHARGEPKAPAKLRGLEASNFLFTIGSIRAARGLDDVVRALAKSSRGSVGHRLLIAGEPSEATRSYRDRMLRLVDKLGLVSQVVWLGQLSEAESSWCYLNCAAFVMTSRVEACPNTVLEAMSHGCLCVSTDDPPMPEFFRDVALYYRASDSDDLARKLDAALSLSAVEAKAMRDRASSRARVFSWDQTARLTVDELAKTIEVGNGAGR